jgi:hypothetical protein
MIRAIGFQRVVIILALIGACVAMEVFNYTIATPQKKKTTTELQSVQGKISSMRKDLEAMQTNMGIFEARRALFAEMQTKGMFGTQDRVEARDQVNTIQKASKVLNARYEVKPATLEAHDVPDNFDYAVIKSDIRIALSAVDDTDIYRFIYFLNYAYPGHITIRDLAMSRTLKIDEYLLKEVGHGRAPAIVEGTLELEWRTLARKDEIDFKAPVEGRGDLQ